MTADDAMAAGLPFPEPDRGDPEVTRIGPDEYLVLSFPGPIHRAALASMRDELKARFPDVADRILIVGGGAQLAVIEKDRKGTDE